MTHWTKKQRHSIFLICSVCTLLALLLRFHERFEYKLRDMLISNGKKASQDSQLMYLAIDGPSLNVATTVFRDDLESSPGLKLMAEGYPWPREVYALLIEKLVKAGAKVVAFDLTFPNPRKGDDEFRAVLDKYKDQVVIGSQFEDIENVGGTKYTAPSYQPPSPSLISPPAEADDRVGYTNFWPMNEVDGVIRTARFRLSGRDYFHKDTRQVFESLGARVLRKAGRMDAIPGGEVCFRFAAVGSGLEFNRHSLYSVFVPRDWETTFQNGAVFKDKIVLVGPHGQGGLKDQLVTPMGIMAGTLIHLSAINAALHDDFISLTSLWEEIIVVLVAGLAALILGLLVEKPVKRFGIILGSCFAYLFLSKIICDFTGHMLPVLSPTLAFFGSGVAIFVKHVRDERNARMQLRQKMERYVSKNVVKELLDNPHTFLNELGGVRKPVTVLITDLRNFTTLAESSDSTQLVQQLNEYFSEMVRIIFKHNGTVDKFIGDAILAVWGNVQQRNPQEDAERAAIAAMEMQEALVRLNANWRERQMPEWEMGIGINSGEVIFGNIGSTEKMEPTVIGDVVNIASRLEGITKQYGVNIIIGEKTAALVGGVCHLQIVDRVQLKGKNRIIQVYTTFGHRDVPLEEGMAKYMETYKTGLMHYQAGRFKEASNAFGISLELRPNDPLAELYRERCLDLDRNPPDHWTGIYVMHHK